MITLVDIKAHSSTQGAVAAVLCRRGTMEEAIEIRGETARQLNALARSRGLTLQELVIHVLLDYLDENYDSDDFETDDGNEEDEDG